MRLKHEKVRCSSCIRCSETLSFQSLFSVFSENWPSPRAWLIGQSLEWQVSNWAPQNPDQLFEGRTPSSSDSKLNLVSNSIWKQRKLWKYEEKSKLTLHLSFYENSGACRALKGTLGWCQLTQQTDPVGAGSLRQLHQPATTLKQRWKL